MQAVKRIELVVPSVALEEVLEQLEHLQVEGYTVIKQVEGKGDRGLMDGDGLHNAFSNSLVIIACKPEALEKFIAPLKRIVVENGGLCLVSDAFSVVD
jgi:nitrogen regulatory protein PII